MEFGKVNSDATLVEIGGIDNLGVQLDASYGLLLNLLQTFMLMPNDGL